MDEGLRWFIRELATDELHPCWIATGGYGRGLLSPGSSIRLMLLHDHEDSEEAEEFLNRVEGVMGEALPNLAVGINRPDEVARRMVGDPLQAINLLETRYLYGPRRLYDAFSGMAQNNFIRECWGTFGEEVLKECLEPRDPYTSSPHSIRVNLKEGAGCLRDIGTVQKLADSLLKVPALRGFWDEAGGQESGLLLPAERRELNRAYDFLLAVRNELQFRTGSGCDVLEMRVQKNVARGLGYAEGGESEGAAAQLLADLSFCAVQVTRLLRLVSERFEHLHAVAWRRSGNIARRYLENDFVEIEGKVYNASPQGFEGTEGVFRMLDAFLISQRRHRSLSQTLLDQIGKHLELVTDSFRRHKHAAETLLDLLSGSVGVAERLRWMRDCGLLQQYIPELQSVVHRVDYEESTDYTLGEHTIDAIRVIDDLAHSRQEDEIRQREVLSRVNRPDLLRLALLLHHVSPGDASALPRIAGRLHLSAKEQRTIHSLVAKQDFLTRLVERHEFDDDRVMVDAAEAIGDAENLRMLYLFTYADSRARGKLGWFAWRDALLYEVYQKILGILDPGVEALATPEQFDVRLLEIAGAEGRNDEARAFLEGLPERYKIEVSPEEALDHMELLETSNEKGAAMTVSPEQQVARIWFCTTDVPTRFSQIAGTLAAHGLNILSARAFSLKGGKVLDRFIVHQKGQSVNRAPEYWNRIEETLVDCIKGRANLEALVAERVQSEMEAYEPELQRGVTSVRFDTESSTRFTIVDLVCWDRLGLLYKIGRKLGELDVNIEFAMISTRLDIAEDVFYINDSKTGEKITSEKRLADIQKGLSDVAESEAAGRSLSGA
jgi:[protein-PII] uridylyltransferase